MMSSSLMPFISRFRLSLFIAAAVIYLSFGVIDLRAQAAPPVPAPSAISGSRVPAVPAPKISIDGIKNAGKVDGFLFRGAQPRPEAYQRLKSLGIEIVVDLHNTGEHERAERQAVESLGMRYLNLAANPLTGPSDSEVAAFLESFHNNPGKKVFVHCSLGADRTGVMIASYRMAFDHWTPRQAFAEMRAFHFHTSLILMSRYVRHFPEHFATDPDFARLRAEASIPSSPAANSESHPTQNAISGSAP